LQRARAAFQRSGREIEMKRIALAFIVMFLIHSGVADPAADGAIRKSFSTPARFVINGNVLATKSAFVVLTDEFFSGRTKALKILFYPEPISAEVQRDVLNNDARAVGKKDHVYLVLFIDKNDQIWQVNLTSVLPGQTLARAIAWKPEELKRIASAYSYDGKRLKYKDTGSYHDDRWEKNPATIEWSVDLDIPVFESLSTKK